MYHFTKDSVVCFVGDSITANGGWIRRIYDYYRLIEKIPCKLINCGVPGDNATNAQFRLEDTVFPLNPTDVVLAFGMNDVRIWLYNDDPVGERRSLERRRAIDSCIDSLRGIAQQCVRRNIRVTFCTPTPYDELQSCDTPVLLGAAAALQEIGCRIRAMAQEFGGHVGDLNTPFNRLLLLLYKKDQTVIGPDRVHPLPEGHEFMARVFLRDQGFDVEIPETLEQLQAMAAQPHDDWEEQRFQLEIQANADSYIHWNYCFGMQDLEIVDQHLARRMPMETNPFIRARMESYAQDRVTAPEYRKKLLQFLETVKI